MTPEAQLIFFKKKVMKTWLQKGKDFMQKRVFDPKGSNENLATKSNKTTPLRTVV